MSNNTIFLKDYRACDYQINSADLIFELDPDNTIIKSHLEIEAKSKTVNNPPLWLDGEDLELLEIRFDGEILDESTYTLNQEGLLLHNPPKLFRLDIVTRIHPATNTALSGLFISNGVFCTQCEPHGFRRMTYFIDRPDNLSRFSTTIIANPTKYPVMLSNGNCVDTGTTEAGQHWVKWEDPFLKPSYLFALVAGKLDLLEDKFITQSGREVTLQLYVDVGELDKTTHAMESLKKSMRWDEEVYGREYDLDIFMTVAVRDFNMGAMENKGLNIFNSKYILANPKIATDVDYENILGVVGHEYFHNWSGNRVTCRDWFQLSLKEGLTVFRDQNFTADHTSAAIKRIDDVNVLRTHQFAEDAGPLAHPVQPRSYIEIDNFYTVTIYNKGAELIRMQHTLLGPEKFRIAMDLYFQRHDGQAVCIEDFVQAMEDASGIDLTQFKRWYHQSGTPFVKIKDFYDDQKKQYKLLLNQTTPATPGQPEKRAFHIPLAVGLLDQNGNEILSTQILQITQNDQEFIFDNINTKPIPSLFRGFSAPVKYEFSYLPEDLALLMVNDTDSFSRWQAAQELALLQINSLIVAYKTDASLQLDSNYITSLRQIILGDFNDQALQALLLTLPNEQYIFQLQQPADPFAIHVAREFLRKTIAKELKTDLDSLYHDNVITGAYCNNANDNAKRRVKNICLSYISLVDAGEQAWHQYQAANNMTDIMAALTALASLQVNYRLQALQDFYQKWQANALVMDKWLMVQATSTLPNTLETVKQLMQNKVFQPKNPNSIRALIGAFVNGNLAQFHAIDGSGYNFLANEVIMIDKFNAQVAATLVRPLLHWQKFDVVRQQLIQQQLERILATKGLSKNTFEMVSKALID